MIACNSGCYEIAKLLIEHGADVNAVQNDGWTPLLLATHAAPAALNWEWPYDYGINPKGTWKPLEGHDLSGKSKVAELLIELVQDVDQSGSNGITPLMMACESGYDQVVGKLIDKGANIEKHDNVWGFTPLMWAVAKRQPNIVKQLIWQGANVNEVDKKQKSVLMIAVTKDASDILPLLVDQGAQINYKTDQSLTALALASVLENKSLSKYLLSNGAQLFQIENEPFINANLHLSYAKFNKEIDSETRTKFYRVAAESFQKAHDQTKRLHEELTAKRAKLIAEENAAIAGAFIGGLLGSAVANYVAIKAFNSNTFVMTSPNSHYTPKYDISSIDAVLKSYEKTMTECIKCKAECLSNIPS